MTNDTSGPAFPALKQPCYEKGMTLRTYIATKVLAAMIAGNYDASDDREPYVAVAVSYADDLIQELDK